MKKQNPLKLAKKRLKCEYNSEYAFHNFGIKKLFKQRRPKWRVKSERELRKYGVMIHGDRRLDLDVKTKKRRWIIELKYVPSDYIIDKSGQITWDTKVKRTCKKRHRPETHTHRIGPIEEADLKLNHHIEDNIFAYETCVGM